MCLLFTSCDGHVTCNVVSCDPMYCLELSIASSASLSCDVLVTTTLLSPIVALQPPAQFQIYTNTIFAFLKRYLVLPCVIVAPPNVTISITWTGLIPSDAFISRSNALVFAQPMGGEYTCHAQGGRASIDLIYNVAIRGKREGEEVRGKGKR